MTDFNLKISTKEDGLGYLEIDGKKFHFLSMEDASKDNNIYLYVEAGQDTINKTLHAKLGMTGKSAEERYYGVTGNTGHRRIIQTWKTPLTDKEILEKLKKIVAQPEEKNPENKGIRWEGDKSNSEINTCESLEIYNLPGSTDGGNLTKLEDLINEITETKGTKARKEKNIYPDVAQFISDVSKKTNPKTYKNLLLDLCPRWGKTYTIEELFDRAEIRICYLASYIKTVKTSYKDSIEGVKGYEHIYFIDPDDNEFKDESGKYVPQRVIDKCLKILSDPKNKIIFFLALTGSMDIFERRTFGVENLKNYKSELCFEEVDFGAHCPNQVEKKDFLSKKITPTYIISTTGTNAFYAETLCHYDDYIRKDYILDVLPNRPDSVGVDWQLFDNRELFEFFGGEDTGIMENMEEYLRVENGKLVGEEWLTNLFELFWLDQGQFFSKYLNSRPAEERRKLWGAVTALRKKHLDDEAATMIFTPNGRNDGELEDDPSEDAEIDTQSPTYQMHILLRDLIQKVVPNSVVKILNGDPVNDVTNETAEQQSKDFIKYHKNKKIFFIAAGMANRSYSIKEIKNVFLLINGGSGAAIQQKVSRGFTWWNENHKVNHIIDFRFDKKESGMSSFLKESAIRNSAANKMTMKEVVEIYAASDKVSFSLYSLFDEIPFKTLSKDEIYQMMLSPRYAKMQTLKVFYEIQNVLSEPKTKGPKGKISAPKLNLFTSVKGDTIQKVFAKSNFETYDDDEDKREKTVDDPKLNHFLFLQKNAAIFDTATWDEDILRHELLDEPLDKEFKLDMKEQYDIDIDFIVELAKVLDKHNGLKHFDELILGDNL